MSEAVGDTARGAPGDDQARSAPARDAGRWKILAAVLVLGILADQATKFMATDRLTTALTRVPAGPPGVAAPAAPPLLDRIQAFYTLKHLEAWSTDPYVVFRPWWRMRYAENPGAAWSIFRDQPVEVRTAFFTLANLVAAIFVILYLRRLGPRHRTQQVALSLVLAGAWGNLVDRWARGYVVDFIDWHWWNRPDLYWPTFNVADSMIVVGVALLLLFPGPRPGQAARE